MAIAPPHKTKIPKAYNFPTLTPEAWQAWAIRQGHEVVASSQATLTQGAHWVQHNGREALTNSRERLTHSASWLQQNALTPAREGLAHSAEWLSRRFTTAQVAPTEQTDVEMQAQVGSTAAGVVSWEEKTPNIEDNVLQIHSNTSRVPKSRVTQVESDQQHKAAKGTGTVIS